MLDTTQRADRPSTRLPAWWGWAVLTLMALAVLVTWLPHMNAPFGDSNEGRILARLAMHVQNFWELGASESGFASSMRPYNVTTNYAHHPPFINLFEVVTSAVFGQGEWQVRLYGYLSGVASPFLLASVLRQLKVSWGPTLLAAGLMMATNFYWVFARMGGGFATTLALTAIVIALRREEHVSPLMLALGGALGLVTVMTSWPAALTAALLGLWLLAGRGIDRVTVVMGVAMVAGALLTGGWILNATDATELRSQTELRTGGEFTWVEFIERQWQRATELTPSWYRALLFPALLAGVADRRTRAVTVVLFLAPFLWTFGGRQGAFNHEFWNYLWMPAIAVGTAVLLDNLAAWIPPRARLVAAAGIAVLLAVSFVSIVQSRTYDIYVGWSTDAGALVKEVDPAPGQTTAYVIQNLSAPRWAAYYWGLQPRLVTADNVDEIPPDDLVVIRTNLLPDWVPEGAADAVVAERGRYGLVPASALR